jgi:hypothetical protein
MMSLGENLRALKTSERFWSPRRHEEKREIPPARRDTIEPSRRLTCPPMAVPI